MSKYADHLPLYRQAQIYARQGIDAGSLDAGRLGRPRRLACCARCMSVCSTRLRGSAKLFADETTAPGARSRPRADQDRPAVGLCRAMTVPGVAPIRRAWPMSTRPIARPSGRSPISQGFKGTLAGRRLRRLSHSSPSAATSDWHSAGRHVRRRFYELATAGLRRSPARRSNASPRSMPSRAISVAAAPRNGAPSRPQKSRPLIDALEPWLRAKLALISQKSKTRRSDPLRALALGGPDPLPRRRPHRDRHQHRRTRDPADRRSTAKTHSSPAPTAAASIGPSSPR